MIVQLIIVPLLAALAAFLVKSERMRPWIVAAAAAAHAVLTFFAVGAPTGELPFSAWLRLDALGRLILPLISTLFLACAIRR